MEQRDQQTYQNVEINFIPGRTPELILYDESNKEVERMMVDEFDYNGLHKLLTEKGFKKKGAAAATATTDLASAATNSSAQQSTLTTGASVEQSTITTGATVEQAVVFQQDGVSANTSALDIPGNASTDTLSKVPAVDGGSTGEGRRRRRRRRRRQHPLDGGEGGAQAGQGQRRRRRHRRPGAGQDLALTEEQMQDV